VLDDRTLSSPGGYTCWSAIWPKGFETHRVVAISQICSCVDFRTARPATGQRVFSDYFSRRATLLCHALLQPKLPGRLTLNTRWQMHANANETQLRQSQKMQAINSLFYYYQRLIRLHAKYCGVVYGKYDLILEFAQGDIRLHWDPAERTTPCHTKLLSAEPAPFRISCSVTTALDDTC
jgi:hypothetical protein